ncbi:hypothetical protein D9M68_576810 [compost metagenome]
MVLCTAYTPTTLTMVIAGTRIQVGTLSMRANRPTSGMFITSRMTLPMNSEAIRPQTTSGCCSNSSGPGVMLYRVRAPIITAVVPEPGTPRVSIGISEPQAEALLAASGAATPRRSPSPKRPELPAMRFSLM